MNDEKYDFTVGEEGLDYDILDYTFNKTTKEFMLNNGLKEGMNILEIGCGSGIMTSWIAKQIGDNGHITSIDNSQEQIHFAQKSIDKQQLMNVSFKCISAYDLEELNMKFDLVYCRFVLHHLHSPRQAIKIFYNCLNHKGIYIAEEGIISSAFSYPPYTSWHHERGTVKQPEIEKDGIDRDGDFGIKLSYNMQDSGFTINNRSLVQPVLSTKKEKSMLITGRESFKDTALAQGMTQQEWNNETINLTKLINDNKAFVAFYQSCQVSGVKS